MRKFTIDVMLFRNPFTTSVQTFISIKFVQLIWQANIDGWGRKMNISLEHWSQKQREMSHHMSQSQFSSRYVHHEHQYMPEHAYGRHWEWCIAISRGEIIPSPGRWLEAHGDVGFADRGGPISARWGSCPVNMLAKARRWRSQVTVTDVQIVVCVDSENGSKQFHGRVGRLINQPCEVVERLFLCWLHVLILWLPLTSPSRICSGGGSARCSSLHPVFSLLVFPIMSLSRLLIPG